VAVTMSVDISGTYPTTPPKVTISPLKSKLNNMITTAQANTLAEEVLTLSRQHLGIPHIHVLAQHVQVSLPHYYYYLSHLRKINILFFIR
jgi:hypothetical protein